MEKSFTGSYSKTSGRQEILKNKSPHFDEHGNEVDFDYYRLMKIIVESGFKGIIAIEYEGTVMPPVEGINATKALIMKSLRQA